MRRPRFLLLTALLGIAGCAGANHLSFQGVKEIHLGAPGIDGNTLHIPIQTNNGRGFVQPVDYLCGVTTTGYGHRIGFSLQHCLGTGPPYIMGARIYFPVLSVPYNGPGTYTVVFVGYKGKKTRIGDVEVAGDEVW